MQGYTRRRRWEAAEDYWCCSWRSATSLWTGSEVGNSCSCCLMMRSWPAQTLAEVYLAEKSLMPTLLLLTWMTSGQPRARTTF